MLCDYCSGKVFKKHDVGLRCEGCGATKEEHKKTRQDENWHLVHSSCAIGTLQHIDGGYDE